MLYAGKDIRKCKIRATDGEIGSVEDVFFDDRSWEVKYVVVDTGNWLPGKRVLIPRKALGTPDWRVTALSMDLSRDEIENSPGIASDPPLVHEANMRYYDSYVWASYPWGGFVGGLPSGDPKAIERKITDPPVTHLRSAREITNYRIEASDGRLGHVEDFLVGTDWKIHYAIIDTRNWLPGKKVVVAPEDIVGMNWADHTAHVKLSQEEIKAAPRLKTSDLSKVLGPRLMEIS